MNKRVAFHTLGCKLNFSETSTIARQFTGEGFERVGFDTEADIYVINTCSVTENADKQFKSIVRQALNHNSDAFIVAIGCYAQLKPQEIASLDGVDLVLGATEKFNIMAYLDDLSKKNEGVIHSCEIEEANFYVGSYAIGDRTRAFLKVQDGCDYKCSFCTIPLARGISRSDTLDNVLDNARKIAEQGIKEIVLTGVNIGDYGKGEYGNKQHDHTFYDLVQALDKVENIDRIRISSIEPNLLKDEIIDFVASSNIFVPHFHIPLQSGSDKILKLMKRRYQRSLYAKKVDQIREIMPDACIGVDVIVGFPGETDEDFLETYTFLNDLNISYLHVFSYSERDNTTAAQMPGTVLPAIRKKRSKMLRGLSAKKRRAYYESQIGSRRKILLEGENKKGYMYGFTENYVRVRTPWDPELVNSILEVKLDGMDEEGMVRFKSLEPTLFQ
ncbi:MAG: tRNA (N(6)-L-threonylcarbamoyladenosine(37)-C(2))-methylthiotransferase MtaB [Flavobacteriaceae bacterium]